MSLLETLPVIFPSLHELHEHIEGHREDFSTRVVLDFLATRLGADNLESDLADVISAEGPPGHMYM